MGTTMLKDLFELLSGRLIVPTLIRQLADFSLHYAHVACGSHGSTTQKARRVKFSETRIT